MRCWNCGKELPDEARACDRCEATAKSEPTEDLMKAVVSLLDVDTQAALHRAFEESRTSDEFIARVLVGPCPQCGSMEVRATDRTVCTGRCSDCGHIWCLECGKVLKEGVSRCTCLAEDAAGPV